MKFPVTGLLVLLALTVVACAPVLVTKSDRLVFQPEIFDDLTGEFVFSLKVRNDGDGVAPARPNANALMELRDEHGMLRASVYVTSLIAIEPGVTLDPAVWRGQLDPGFYQLYWGAPGLGHTQIHFVVDEVNGRPQLGDMRIMPLPDQDMPALPAHGVAQPLVDLAIAQLAEQLDVEVGLIRVERVEPVDFPDASLGAPQPDMMYAQVITPGYVVELSYQGVPYVFHGSGQQVVLVPQE
jgi:hypothetical protein